MPQPTQQPWGEAWTLTQGLSANNGTRTPLRPGCSSLVEWEWLGPCRASPFPSAASLWGSLHSSSCVARTDQGSATLAMGSSGPHGGNPGAWPQPFPAPALAELGVWELQGTEGLLVASHSLWVPVLVWLHHGLPASCSNTETAQPHPWLANLYSQ